MLIVPGAPAVRKHLCGRHFCRSHQFSLPGGPAGAGRSLLWVGDHRTNRTELFTLDWLGVPSARAPAEEGPGGGPAGHAHVVASPQLPPYDPHSGRRLRVMKCWLSGAGAVKGRGARPGTEWCRGQRRSQRGTRCRLVFSEVNLPACLPWRLSLSQPWRSLVTGLWPPCPGHGFRLPVLCPVTWQGFPLFIRVWPVYCCVFTELYEGQ